MAYVGLFAALVLAPLAWSDPRQRPLAALWLVLGCVALSWTVAIPGAVAFWRLPGLNMFSHNRFVFAAGFALLALAVAGLDALWRRRGSRVRWFWLPAAVPVALGSWCVFRAANLPEPISTRLRDALGRGVSIAGVPDLATLARVRDAFTVPSVS